jgi:hypothetical protein
MKAGEYTRGAIYVFDGTLNLNAIFDLAAGTVASSGSAATASISGAGNGWFRCVVSGAISSTGGGGIRISANAGGGVTEATAGDGTSGIFIWGAQLELGSTASAYQKVVSTYDVTEAGQADNYFLWFDGVDDRMVTSAKISVGNIHTICAGIKINSLIAGANSAIFDLGDLENGSATRAALDIYNDSGTYRLRSFYPSIDTFSTGLSLGAAAPDPYVVSVIRESGTSLVQRNPAAETSLTITTSSADFAEPNFLRIGQHRNAAQYLNGQIYSLIVRGALTEGNTLTQTETYVAGKTAGVDLT